MKDQWHLNKEVTVSQIILMVSIIGVGVTAWFSMDTRVTVLEGFPDTHKETHDNFNEMQRAMFIEVTEHIKDLKLEIRENRKIIIEELRR